MIKIFCEDYDFSPLASALSGEAEADCDLSVEVILCDEEYIKNLNAGTRGIDAVTDVLSYPSLDHIRGAILKKADYPADLDEEGNIFLGSIAICKKKAEEQAEEYGHSYFRELNYLAAHGVLHLLGYDHIEEADRAEMRLREERVLEKIDAVRGV